MKAAGFDPTERWTDTSATQLETGQMFRLGQLVTDDDGNIFIHVHAAGAIVLGDVCLIDENWEADAIDTTNSATGFGQPCGVATAAFADNDYGWLQVWGVNAAIGVADAAAANVQLNTTAADGLLDDDATSGAEVVVGIALTTAEDTGLTAPGFINWPRVGATL